MLSAAALRDVRRFCGSAADCDSLPDLQSQVLGAFEELFHYDSCVFHPRSSDGCQHDLSRCATRGCCTDFVPKYLERYYREDPCAAEIRDRQGCPPWGVRLSTEMLDYDTLVASRYYNEFLRPNGAHYSLIMMLGLQGRQVGVAVISRDPRRPNFSAADRLKAELVLPILAAVVDRCMQNRLFGAQAWALGTVCRDLIRRPLLILDSDFTPICYNDDARAILDAPGRGQEPAPLRVPDEIIAACRGLATCPDRSGSRGAMLPFVGDTGAGASGPLWLERGDLDGQPIYLVLLGPDRTGGGLQERLRQYDLSRRESEVALLVARGRSTPEISRALCRSINTIETHLKSIFRKMGVNSRAGVAHRLYAP